MVKYINNIINTLFYLQECEHGDGEVMWHRSSWSGRNPRWHWYGLAFAIVANLSLLLVYLRQPVALVTVSDMQETHYRVIPVIDAAEHEMIHNQRHEDIVLDSDGEHYEYDSTPHAEAGGISNRLPLKDQVKPDTTAAEHDDDNDINIMEALQSPNNNIYVHESVLHSENKPDVLSNLEQSMTNVPSHYYYRVLPKTEMCHSETFLVILVCSAVRNLDLRDAIRNTWGSAEQKHPIGIQLIFVLGNIDEQFNYLKTSIEQEIKQFSDILQIDLEDNYRTLSLKTLGALNWVTQNCHGAKFVMKTDDDVFINLHNLVQDLAMRVEDPMNFILGHVIQGAKPIKNRHDKWYMPDTLYRNKVYPTYLSGTAYVMSYSLVPSILQASRSETLFWLEDVYITGILAKKSNATLVDNSKYLYKKPAGMNICKFHDIISSHEMGAPDLYQLWKDLARSGIDCENVVNSLHMNGGLLLNKM